ncbi:MAG: lasso peptide biosynthesis B2 protein [Caldilineaceae bacterium]|nr:lasso peptide biosynthesis B2 protein [Caldilineaceae bacterium]
MPSRAARASRKIHNLWRRPWADKWLLVQVFVLLGFTRLAILTLSFPRLARHFGPLRVETPADATPEQLATARHIAWAIRRISPYTPWTSNCFPQALTAKILLRRLGISSTLYLGAAFSEDKSGLEAHAWLRCGSLYITGGKGDEKFGTVGVFGE